MENSPDSLMQKRINQYKQVIDHQMVILSKAKEDTRSVLADLEKETMNLMKDRKLSPAERVNRMAPFIEEQDKYNNFLESIENLLNKYSRKQDD